MALEPSFPSVARITCAAAGSRVSSLRPLISLNLVLKKPRILGLPAFQTARIAHRNRLGRETRMRHRHRTVPTHFLSLSLTKRLTCLSGSTASFRRRGKSGMRQTTSTSFGPVTSYVLWTRILIHVDGGWMDRIHMALHSYAGCEKPAKVRQSGHRLPSARHPNEPALGRFSATTTTRQAWATWPLRRSPTPGESIPPFAPQFAPRSNLYGFVGHLFSLWLSRTRIVPLFCCHSCFPAIPLFRT
ncbi:hypothetical protein FB451DRAFT_1280966 [Mycena latifolia]|nr:hypothetical protein FB451DRAFT_1280966 [Mycena latifolia]